MYVKFCNLKPNKQLKKELDEAYHRVMNSGIYLNGNEVKSFEQEWREFTQQKYCIALGSGYDGLLLAISTLRNYEGEILVPNATIPLVYSAVTNCNCLSIRYSKAKGKYEVGILVHLYGQRDKTKLNCKYLIGDYSQAHGLIPQEDINVWSFYPTKNLGGYGNNGAITTNNKTFYDRILQLKECQKLNSKMDELQAAFLRVKLRYLKAENKKRKQLAQLYMAGLQDLEWLELPDLEDSVIHQFVIKTKHRDRLKQFLIDKKIETLIHYENMADVLSLPIASHLTEKQIEYVIKIIKTFKV